MNKLVIMLFCVAWVTSCVEHCSAWTINFNVSGCSISGIQADGVLQDGSYQRLTYFPYTGSVQVANEDEWVMSYCLPFDVEIDDLGLIGDSGWVRTPRTFTVEGQSWSSGDGFDTRSNPANGYPWHKITLSGSGVIGISTSSSWDSACHVFDIGPTTQVDLGMPAFGQVGIGISPGGSGSSTYPKVFHGSAPIAFRVRTVPPVMSISLAKKQTVGTLVRLKNVVQITSMYYENEKRCFYVESPDRSASIKIFGFARFAGDSLEVIGRLDNADDEWFLADAKVVRILPGVEPRPLMMSTRDIIQRVMAPSSGKGLDMIGLKVRVGGRLTYKSEEGDLMYIDDGFSYVDGLAQGIGLRAEIATANWLPGLGRMMAYEGIIRKRKHTLTNDTTIGGVFYPAGSVVTIPYLWKQSEKLTFY